MTAVLLWKEYRQQRAFWLAIVVLALLVATTENQVFSSLRNSFPLPGIMQLITLCLVFSYGVVSGALLLASEEEDGTQPFLDNLTGRRSSLWLRKVLAGVLFMLLLSGVLATLAVVFDFANGGAAGSAKQFAFHGMNALAWGLLGGVLRRNVLTAILTALFFLGGGWCLYGFFLANPVFVFLEAASTVLATYASWRIYCRDDLARRPAIRPYPIRLGATLRKLAVALRDWRVISWLAIRQGRWVLVAGLAAAILLGFTVNRLPNVIWPLGTLLLGMVLGLTSFCPDQNEANRFLGAPRIPPGRFWAGKNLFWGTALLGLVALIWFIVFRLARTSYWIEPWHEPGSGIIALFRFLGFWPVYGFCLGQFFGLVARRPVIAIIQAAVVTPVIAGLWMPSLIVGGVSNWQALGIPLLLLIATRLAVWPWMAGRLWTLKPLAGIATVVGLIAIGQIAFLWQRAYEVPDLGEPFDVKAFVDSLPSPAHNEAGPLMHRAVAGLESDWIKAIKELGPVSKWVSAAEPGPFDPKTKVDSANVFKAWANNYENLLSFIVIKGWPGKGQAVGRWLDLLFQGKWVEDARQAARLPLGMYQDPRLVHGGSRALISDTSLKEFQSLGRLGSLFAARAIQLQAHGESRGALDQLETALALSRQIKNYGPLTSWSVGDHMEASALSGFRYWLEKMGPDRDLLRAALMILQRHEAATPALANSVRAQYVIERDALAAIEPTRGLAANLVILAYQVPWEEQRQQRILHAINSGELRIAKEPYWEFLSWLQLKDSSGGELSHFAVWTGLPPKEGPGSQLSPERWGAFLSQRWHTAADLRQDFFSGLVRTSASRLRQLRAATQLVTALALYQTEQGKPPAKLDELIPAYLKDLPINPYDGKPFNYRISAGERINEGGTIRLAPGQALVWCPARPLLPAGSGLAVYFPVPVWTKK